MAGRDRQARKGRLSSTLEPRVGSLCRREAPERGDYDRCFALQMDDVLFCSSAPFPCRGRSPDDARVRLPPCRTAGARNTDPRPSCGDRLAQPSDVWSAVPVRPRSRCAATSQRHAAAAGARLAYRRPRSIDPRFSAACWPRQSCTTVLRASRRAVGFRFRARLVESGAHALGRADAILAGTVRHRRPRERRSDSDIGDHLRAGARRVDGL